MLQASVVATPFLALVAGIVTSLTPCSLSNIPLMIGFVGQGGKDMEKRTFRIALAFVAGTTATFIVLGLVASLLGQYVTIKPKVWSIILGILMFALSMQILGVWHMLPTPKAGSKNERTGYGAAFLAGIAGGLFASPCSVPMLIVLLGLSARSGNAAWGILLLLLYSVGHSVLVMLAGAYSKFLPKLQSSERSQKVVRIVNMVMGLLLLAVALGFLFLKL